MAALVGARPLIIRFVLFYIIFYFVNSYCSQYEYFSSYPIATLPSSFGQGRTSAGDSARSKQPVPIQPRTHTRSQDGRRVVADSARAECLENECHAQASTQSGKTELTSFTWPTHLAFVFGFFAWAPNSWLKIFAEHPTAGRGNIHIHCFPPGISSSGPKDKIEGVFGHACADSGLKSWF